MLLHCGPGVLDLARPTVMGVLNVTPDSFSDGGHYLDADRAIERALQMAAEGAAIIDIGGESTRPGAAPVSVDEELRRVIPVIEALKGRTSAVLSVDTSRPEVMRAASRAGAGLLNDVRALRLPGALAAARESGCAVCLMHMQGEPGSMQREPHYQDVVGEVREFLRERTQACVKAGIPEERIVIDPGIGFGKTLDHNLTLVRRLPELAADGRPLLVGVSRKSTIGAITGRGAQERLPGSLAMAAIAVLKGAVIIRAHDVAATLDAMKVALAVRNSSAERGG